MSTDLNRYLRTVMTEYDGRITGAEGELAKPVVYFTAANVSVVEGNAGTTIMTLTVRRSSLAGALSVTGAYVPGTAMASDFPGGMAPGDKVWSFVDGSDTASVDILINGDVDVEANETFGYRLMAASAYRVGSPASVTGTILNDDTAAVTGLLFRSEGAIEEYTGNDGSWATRVAPEIVSFDRAPFVAQAPQAGGADAGGNREGFLFKDDNGKWYIYYGAGNGIAGTPGGPWRIQASESSDGGMTWTKRGPLNMQLSHGYDGGNWAAIDNLFIEKRAGVYYIHRLTAFTENANVCGQPYTSDVWSASSPLGPFTYVGRTVESGASGTFDERDAYASCIVFDNGVYHLFYSAATSASRYQIGRATSSSPAGPFTKVGGAVIPTDIRGEPENPEVFYSTTLQKWVMVANMVTKSLGRTAGNRAYFSDSLTDWSGATYTDIHRFSPMDGMGAIGMLRYNRNPDNSPALDTLGNIATIFDADPTEDNHVGRKLYYTALEPSKQGLSYSGAISRDNFQAYNTGALGGQGGWIDWTPGGVSGSPMVIVEGGRKVVDFNNFDGRRIVTLESIGTAKNIRLSAVASLGSEGVSGLGLVFGYRPAAFTSNGTTLPAGAHFFPSFSPRLSALLYWDGTAQQNLKLANPNPIAVTSDDLHNYSCDYDEGTFVMKIDGQEVLRHTLTDPVHLALMDGGYVGIRKAINNGRSVVRSFGAYPLTSQSAPIFKAVSHARVALEFAARAPLIGSVLDVFCRLQGATSINDGYRIRLNFGGAGQALVEGAWKRVGGVETALTNSAGARTLVAREDFFHRFQLSINGSAITVKADGETQLVATDATFATGAAFALRAGNGPVEVRQLHARKGDAVTVNGVSAGQVVTLRGAGGIPMTSATSTGSSIVLTSAHYPVASVDVAGVQRFAPTGGIWGGDILQ